jgi:hypothetical protein
MRIDHWRRVAAWCYGTVALGSALFGMVYLARQRWLPYHEAAAGMPWEGLAQREQAVVVALLRVVGGGGLATGAALGALLGPLRQGQHWAASIASGIGLMLFLPALIATWRLRQRTNTATPWPGALVAVVLLIGGWLAARRAHASGR